MSAISEHLAELEFFFANGHAQSFSQTALAFMQVHWRDIIHMIPVEQMDAARAEIPHRLRDQHGDEADKYIIGWNSYLGNENA